MGHSTSCSKCSLGYTQQKTIFGRYRKTSAEQFSVGPPRGNSSDVAGWKSDAQSRLAKLRVYFRSPKLVTTREEPRYPDLSALMAGLGGAISVYLGASVFTLLDVLEFACDRLWRAIGCHKT